MKLNLAETLIITDFDGTLSKRYVDGVSVNSMMAILRDGNFLSPEVQTESQKISSFYYPIELDPTVNFTYKCQMMSEWWRRSYEIMARGGLNETMVRSIAKSKLLQLRDGVTDFLNFTTQHQLPVLIYSASGIGGEVIPIVLKDRGLFNNNVKVISNKLEFDEKGGFTRAVEPIITSTNKVGNTLSEYGFYQNGTKKQCLILGDSFDDAQMADGLDFDLVYKIAFAEDDQRLDFEKKFDLVLGIEVGFEEIINLFK